MSKTKVTPLRNPHATIDNIDGIQSEDDLALGFVDHLVLADGVPFFRYCAEWSQWLHWDGKRWARERTHAAYDKVRQFLRHMVDDTDRNSRRALGKAATVAAVERMAKADRRCASVPEDWDPDPFLLNTPGGVVDLATGEVERHRPSLFMTKMATAEPGGDCPRWIAFLEEITGGDVELQRFLQRMVGYCLTGSTRDHALFFLYGTGGNGKGVFLNTLTKVLGEYAKVAPMEAFTESKSDRHPTELAMLQGARLVVAQETEEGRGWAESRIKSMTGGDPITARWMRGDFFTYVPQFKLVIAGNHKPGLRAVDEAISRRLHLIPFAITIPPERRDPHLPDALLAEAGGILRWAIEGCLAWQREGLNPPKAVRDTTADYLEAQDSLQAWVEDCCEVNVNRKELPGVLFASWKAWAEKAGEPTGTLRRFGDRLEAAGFRRSRSHGVRWHDGLTVRAKPSDDPDRGW